MVVGTMATAAGAAVLLYYILSRRLAAKGRKEGDQDQDQDQGGDFSRSRSGRKRRRRSRIVRRPAQAPATWLETITTLSETLRFTYSETLGKWPVGDLAFGINYLMRREGNMQVASVYAGSNCLKLKGPEILAELKNLLGLLTLCMYFSNKPFRVFFELAGYSQDDILLIKPKAGILKPVFTIIHDKDSKHFLLLIRGTHSIRDTLTAATGAGDPFHHSIFLDGGISNLVLGHAHCGMVAAARWIAKLSTPCLLKALGEYPDHRVKIVGHSLGGGTAALLTYILRERKEFSSSTCVTFAPAACMTWDLAESGKSFITTVINGADVVPTLSAASVDYLRSEVTASSWLNDLRDQIERTRVLNVVYHSATALGSRLPSIASAKARVAGTGALLRPVSIGTQVIVKRARNVAQAVKTRLSLSSRLRIGSRHRTVHPPSNSEVEDLLESSVVSESSEVQTKDPTQNELECHSSSGSEHDDTEEDEPLIPDDRVITSSAEEDVTEGELWHELEKELERQANQIDIQAQKEEAAAAEVNVASNAAETRTSISSTESSESRQFYPPGRIMHMVSIPASDSANNIDGPPEEHVSIYETPRELYSKIRLSRTMITDHYMPMYKNMIELLIRELENEDCTYC